MRTARSPHPARRLVTTSSLVAVALLSAACQRTPAPVTPAPTTPPGAAVGDLPPLQIPADAAVRVRMAGSEGWLDGRWVTTSAGCQGVILTESQLLVLLPTLTAVERAISAAGGEEWQPVPLARIHDGAGCEPPTGI